MDQAPQDPTMPPPTMHEGNGIGAALSQNSSDRINGSAAPDAQTTTHGISEDEIALYDRQIRLWGVQAQEKIRSANILLITMKGIANEIAKNLVLAGVGSLTIVDHEPVTPADLGAQFLLSGDEGGEHLVGMNRAEAASPQVRRLNPRVRVYVDTDDIRAKGPSYFQGFDIVIATDLDPDTLNIINTATRLNGRPFYAAGAHGMYGFIFSDLIEHDFVIQRDASNVQTAIGHETRTRLVVDVRTKRTEGRVVELVTKRELYSTWFLASDAAGLPEEYRKSPRRLRNVTPTLPCLRALWEFIQLNGRVPGHTRDDLQQFTILANVKHNALGLPAQTLRSEFLRSFLQNIGAEIAPVTALIGGQLAQDVINVLGHSQQPIQNMVLFDGNALESPVYPLHPEGALGAALLPLSTLSAVPPVAGNGDATEADGATDHSSAPDPSMSGAMPMGVI